MLFLPFSLSRVLGDRDPASHFLWAGHTGGEWGERVMSVRLESGHFPCGVAVALTTRPRNLQKSHFHFRSVSLIKWVISSYKNLTM